MNALRIINTTGNANDTRLVMEDGREIANCTRCEVEILPNAMVRATLDLLDVQVDVQPGKVILRDAPMAGEGRDVGAFDWPSFFVGAAFVLCGILPLLDVFGG